MSRSKHTRPRHIIAADRVRSPRARRGARDPKRDQQLLFIFNEIEIDVAVELRAGGRFDAESRIMADPARRPRITACRPRSGYFHPADKLDVRSLLDDFGELSWYGLHEVCLGHGRFQSGKLAFGCLQVPGKILLYEQPAPPWFVAGDLQPEQAEWISNAGGIIQSSSFGFGCKIDWPERTLTDFMLFDVLMHEVGHHIVQQFKGKRQTQVLRRKDHEALALAFARRCRRQYRLEAIP